MTISKILSLLQRCCALLPLIAGRSLAADWNAGRNLLLNDKPDWAQETLNPRLTVPEWSFGDRGTLESAAPSLYPTREHVDGSGRLEELEGFTHDESDVHLLAVMKRGRLLPMGE